MTPYSRPASRRYLKGEETREQILQAAKKLFMHRGYHNTSTYDLFESAGITKGAFYHHWKTKEELALTILEDMRRTYEAKIFSIVEAPGTARELINQTLDTIIELNASPDWHYCKLMAMWTAELDSSQDELGRAVQAMRTRWRAFWQQLLQRAQEQGDLRADIPARELSFLVVSTICGVNLSGKKEGTGGENGDALHTLRKLLFR